MQKGTHLEITKTNKYFRKFSFEDWKGNSSGMYGKKWSAITYPFVPVYLF